MTIVLMNLAKVRVASELVAAVPDRVQRNDASTSEQFAGAGKLQLNIGQ
jgi:hypothetical protein